MTTRIFTKVDPIRGNHESEAYTENGGRTWRWSSNDQFISVDTCRNYGIPCDEAAQEAARDAQVEAFVEEYRRNRADEPDDERRFEARAAFGPGVELVNVITGRRWTT